MTVVFDGMGHVSHGVLAIESDPENYASGDLDAAYADCVSGLVGASTPGYLSIEAGPQTGYFGLKVETLGAEPPVNLEWEEIIEVSFTPASEDMTFADFGDVTTLEMSIEVQPYRVRYNAKGLDEAAEEGFIVDDDMDPLSTVLLQFWPAPSAPAVIVKATSEKGEIMRRQWSERA